MRPTIPVLVCLMIFSMLSSACATIITTPTPNNELDRMIAAQEQATDAVRSLQRVAAQATSRADATREALILIGQQTRIAQDALATQTTFVQRMSATALAQSVQQTRAANEARATATAISAQATATVQAAQFTATANSIIVEATRASASATATANAANAQSTRVSANATATVTTAQIIAAQEKAEWDKRLESGRAIAWFVGWAIALIASAIIVGFAAIRILDAVVLRVRVIRDKTGVPFVIMEPDRDGRQMMFAPSRQPGAVTLLTPPQEMPMQIEAGAIDPDTTKRDQAVSLMLASSSRNGTHANQIVNGLGDSRMQIVDAPPPQLVSGDTPQLLEAQWKEIKNDDQDHISNATQ